MDTKTYSTIDRQSLEWPSGVWDTEPDKKQWPDAATGLPCLAVRNPVMGNWCGYVGVAPGHPAYKKPYDDLPVQVHGGLTFSGFCHRGDTEASGICHAPGPGEEAHVYWLGFDCHHAFDIAPSDLRPGGIYHRWAPLEEMSYKTLAYVEEQCQALAAQLARLVR